MADECTVSCRLRRAAFSYGDAVKTITSEPAWHSLLIRVIRVLTPWGRRRPHATDCLTSVTSQKRQHRWHERWRHRHLVMRDVRQKRESVLRHMLALPARILQPATEPMIEAHHMVE